MKALFLSVFDGLFPIYAKKDATKIKDNIFLTSTDIITNRTLIIEGDAYSVWVYMLSPDKESIDFKGFLCAVVDPKSLIDTSDNSKNIKETPLPTSLINGHSYVRNLKKEDIQINWQNECASINIRNKSYLVMDLKTKTSYSKGLIRDCDYGKVLKS